MQVTTLLCGGMQARDVSSSLRTHLLARSVYSSLDYNLEACLLPLFLGTHSYWTMFYISSDLVTYNNIRLFVHIYLSLKREVNFYFLVSECILLFYFCFLKCPLSSPLSKG